MPLVESSITMHSLISHDIDSITTKPVKQLSIAGKVTKLQRMIDYFNEYCAGKQSESAYKAAQKLTAEEANN